MRFLAWIVVALFLVFASAGGAQAITITFETVGGISPVDNATIPLNYFGFDFTANPASFNATEQFFSGSGPGHSGSWYWLNDNRSRPDMIVTLHSGGTFSFSDLWLQNYDPGTITGTILGKLAGSQVGSVGFSAGSAGWTHIVGNFATVDTLVIQTATPSNGALEVDDLTVTSLAVVPEPASAMVALLGGLGLLGRRARRARR